MMEGSDISIETYKELETHLSKGLPGDMWILGRRLLRQPLEKKALAVVMLYKCPNVLKNPGQKMWDELEGYTEHIISSRIPSKETESYLDTRKDAKGTALWFASKGKTRKRVVWVY